ncbi:MAG TPA: hypothetical protein VFH70_10190, partial [Acidimicrobiales bacterium]|nr:hypothetical protein [Acidimicrobiales bacterium]
MVAADGGVFTNGSAAGFFGSAARTRLRTPMVAIAEVPSTQVGSAKACCLGYWLAAAGGGVFTFGSARYNGSMGGKHLNAPVVGIAATPTGKGYWLVARDGGVFTFGDARFLGSAVGRSSSPVVGMAATSDGGGYWILHSNAVVDAYGDAPAAQVRSGLPSGEHAVGLTPDQSGHGFYVAGSSGTVLSAGDAPALSAGGGIAHPVVAIGPAGLSDRSSSARLLEADGTVVTIGSLGVTARTAGSTHLNAPVVGFSQIF